MAGESRHDRAYRSLLRLFPSDFRGDFGDDMFDFRDQCRDARGRRRATTTLGLRTLTDLTQRAPREARRRVVPRRAARRR